MTQYSLLNKEEISTLSHNQPVQGICIIQSYDSAQTKTGSSYFNGILKAQGNLGFKVWSGALYDKLLEEDYKGVPVFISAKVNVWNDSKSLVLEDVHAVNPQELGIDITELDPTNYDLDANEKEFYGLMRSRLSPEVFPYFQQIYRRIRKEFRQEFAAVTVHDAQRGGLLAHTLKMARILDSMWETYSNISDNINSDVVFLGLAIHDMGKIVEYNQGTRTSIAYATHNFLGQEILFEFKDSFLNGFTYQDKEGTDHKVEPLGEDFYYRLQSIIQQHHGEFGEPCHTVEAYIVHLVDMFESRFQMLEETVPFTGSVSVEFGKYRIE